MTEWDKDELAAELEASRRSLEHLADKLCCAIEAGDTVWAAALVIAVKTTASQVKNMRRKLTLEVAG